MNKNGKLIFVEYLYAAHHAPVVAHSTIAHAPLGYGAPLGALGYGGAVGYPGSLGYGGSYRMRFKSIKI